MLPLVSLSTFCEGEKDIFYYVGSAIDFRRLTLRIMDLRKEGESSFVYDLRYDLKEPADESFRLPTCLRHSSANQTLWKY